MWYATYNYFNTYRESIYLSIYKIINENSWWMYFLYSLQTSLSDLTLQNSNSSLMAVSDLVTVVGENQTKKANQKALLYISEWQRHDDLTNLKLSRVQTSLHFFFTCTQKILTQTIPGVILMLQSFGENIKAYFGVLWIDNK